MTSVKANGLALVLLFLGIGLAGGALRGKIHWMPAGVLILLLFMGALCLVLYADIKNQEEKASKQLRRENFFREMQRVIGR